MPGIIQVCLVESNSVLFEESATIETNRVFFKQLINIKMEIIVI